MSQPSLPLLLLASSYFPPETTTSLSLAANHLVEVGQQQQQELTLSRGWGGGGGLGLIGTAWREKAIWREVDSSGRGWEMRQARVWRTKVWARPSKQGVGAGAAKVRLGEKPRNPQSILIPHQ